MTGSNGKQLNIWQKFRSYAPEDWTKEDLLTLLHWWKQVIAIIAGLVFGILPITGWPGFVGYIAINISTAMMLYRGILKLDEEDFGGHGDLLNEGQAFAVGSFMVTWILAYTSLHT